MIDRSEVNRALAKAIAYKNCGDDRKANQWATELVKLLECAAILNDAATSPAEAVYAPSEGDTVPRTLTRATDMGRKWPEPVGTQRTVNGMPVEMRDDGRWHWLRRGA